MPPTHAQSGFQCWCRASALPPVRRTHPQCHTGELPPWHSGFPTFFGRNWFYILLIGGSLNNCRISILANMSLKNSMKHYYFIIYFYFRWSICIECVKLVSFCSVESVQKVLLIGHWWFVISYHYKLLSTHIRQTCEMIYVISGWGEEIWRMWIIYKMAEVFELLFYIEALWITVLYLLWNTNMCWYDKTLKLTVM
jgi:hypothetical protein